MRVGKPHPLRREPVNGRRGDLTAVQIIALNVPIPQVVGVDDEHVRLFGGFDGRGEDEEEEAAVYFAIWQVGDGEVARVAALERYRLLAAGIPKAIYHTRLEILEEG